MDVVVLKLGIFPDADTIERALARLPRDCVQSVFEVSKPERGESEWDRMLDRLLVADRIIVV
ncbi:MAG TPA: hypothetical protein VNF69_13480 [Burkholderiales bacterium]|nr:hypothetical protein [Burkholderiales bacterium]